MEFEKQTNELELKEDNENLNIDLVVEKLASLYNKECSEKSRVMAQAEEEASKNDVYIAITDRYLYREERRFPSKDTHPISLYHELTRNEILSQYFSQPLFEKIYKLCRILSNENGVHNSYDFRIELIRMMHLYVIYKEEFKMENEMSFETFVKEDVYGKQKRKEKREAFEKAREEYQKNFVPKNDTQLRELYNEQKSFIEHNYYNYVDSIDCTDIISFGEFLKLYDLADRNYRYIDGYIDHRILTEVVNKYYETFTQTLNCKEIVDISKFWEIFNKCIELDAKKDFKQNVVNEIQKYIESLNIGLDSLYSRKK